MAEARAGRPVGRAHFCPCCGHQAMTKGAVRLLLVLDHASAPLTWDRAAKMAELSDRGARRAVVEFGDLFAYGPELGRGGQKKRTIRLSREGKRVAAIIREDVDG